MLSDKDLLDDSLSNLFDTDRKPVNSTNKIEELTPVSLPDSQINHKL